MLRILEIQGLAKSSSIIFQILITNGYRVKLAGMFKTQNGTTRIARIQITLTIIKSDSVTTVKPMKIWFPKPEHCTI